MWREQNPSLDFVQNLANNFQKTRLFKLYNSCLNPSANCIITWYSNFGPCYKIDAFYVIPTKATIIAEY